MSILDELYYGNISGADYRISEECKTLYKKLSLAYDKLKERLSEEDFACVDECIKLHVESSALIEKDMYIQGFKTGLLIGIECNKITK